MLKKGTLPRDVYTHVNEIISCTYHGKKNLSFCLFTVQASLKCFYVPALLWCLSAITRPAERTQSLHQRHQRNDSVNWRTETALAAVSVRGCGIWNIPKSPQQNSCGQAAKTRNMWDSLKNNNCVFTSEIVCLTVWALHCQLGVAQL